MGAEQLPYHSLQKRLNQAAVKPFRSVVGMLGCLNVDTPHRFTGQNNHDRVKLQLTKAYLKNMSPDNIQAIIFFVGGPVLILFVWVFFQQLTISRIRKNQKILLEGSKGKDLEEIIISSKQKISALDDDIRDLYEITEKVGALSHRGLHKVGMVRFNPFRDIGGDQSFSVALLDGDNNGVVVSSLYSRDGVRVYAKQLKNGISEKHQLTEEEKHAIAIASAEKTTTQDKKKV